ncbi:MAG TPA: protein kinase [Pirellulales bacterium]|nr:protein kinase [Pirellulales bacterium]
MARRPRLNADFALESATGHLYRNIQHIGGGGTAETHVVLATNGPNRGLLFTAKIFSRLSKPEWRNSFLNEHAFLSKCDHPAILRVYDQGIHLGEAPFIVTECLSDTLAKSRRALRRIEQLSLATQLLSALAYLDNHEPRVVHRDIKPTNIFFKGESWVLGDFGLLKQLPLADDRDRELLKESLGPGMPQNYRTPDLVEYLRGGAPPTPKSDVFQLGLVLAEVFTGKNPHKPATTFESEVGLDPLAPITEAHGAPIAELLNRMLSIRPEDRPSAADVLPQWQDQLLLEARRSRLRRTNK